MGALADLLLRAAPVANLAKAANPAPIRLCDSQDSQDSQGVVTEIRGHLLHLAADAGLPVSLLDALDDDDLRECHGLSDDTLRDWLRLRDHGARMDAGQAPLGYSKAVQCAGCGPVLLWPTCPERVAACPWCFRRKAGKAIPRPSIANEAQP